MNFFEHQDTARRNTRWLVIFMLLAVASLVLITTAACAAIITYLQLNSDSYIQSYEQQTSVFSVLMNSVSFELLAYITLGVGLVVALGSVYKMLQLGSGGKRVAEAMGGRLLNTNTRDADEKKILNVVEEMAIASGTPVPPVYLIDDDSINAFAAGFKPQDAVIGITRGCIRLLSRDELQGVIAHEFSHILHGDMRLNIRLVGLLHGILVIGLIGYLITRSAGFASLGRRRNNPMAMFAIGISLIIIGYAGTFFGNIIKAAVSRQREFLADASAVQFTRNPDGISGALKKIGGYSAGSRLQSPHAAEFSHMYFGQGIVTRFNTLMATHPPLPVRIKRIEPNWRGQFPTVSLKDGPARTIETETEAMHFAGAATAAAPTGSPDTANSLDSAIEQIGAPDETHLQYAHQLLAGLPPALTEAVHDPYAARALVYGLLLHSDDQILEQQLQWLRQHADPTVFKLTGQFHTSVGQLDPRTRLPLLDLCIPALKALSPTQYQVFRGNVIGLIKADKKVELFEWSLYRILTHHLEPAQSSGGHKKIRQLLEPCRVLLSIIAHSGKQSNGNTRAAYDAAMKQLIDRPLVLIDKKLINLPELDRALDQLNQLAPLEKPRLIKAIATCIGHDNKITPTEAELFRAIADSLDCPVPPILK